MKNYASPVDPVNVVPDCGYLIGLYFPCAMIHVRTVRVGRGGAYRHRFGG